MLVANIVLVGTSHIAKQSVHEVDAAIEKYDPALIAIELDRPRLEGLLHPRKQKMSLRDIRNIGMTGYVFSLIGAWAEKHMGGQVGMKPGADMLRAVKVAQAKKIPVALIDQDIGITLKRLSKEVTWKEKGRFVIDIIKGLVARDKKLPFDLRTVPTQDVIDMLIKEVRKRYPNVYRVLVAERNDVMAQRLARLSKKEPERKIVAIIGAGHEQEMATLIRRYLTTSI